MSAKVLSEYRQRGHNENRHAAPAWLPSRAFQAIHATLNAPAAARVSATIDKDLRGIETSDLAPHLAGTVKL